MQFCELTKKEYQQFQMKHDQCNFLNGVETMDLEKMLGYEIEYVGVKEKEEIICASSLVKMPTLKKFYFYYAPRGILIDYQNIELLRFFTKEFISFAKKRGIVYFICDPYILYKERDIDGNLVEGGFNHRFVIENLKEMGFIHKGFSIGYGKTMQSIRWMYTMSLHDKSSDIVWKELHQQTRWSINKTLKSQMQVKELNEDELEVFYNIMQQTGERRQFDSRELSFYQNQKKAYGDKLKVLLAYLDIPKYKGSIEKELEKTLVEKQEIVLELEKLTNSKKFTKKLKVIEEAIETANKRLYEANKLEEKYGQQIPMAASMFAMYGEEVTYLTSGAYEEFRGFYAPYAIQWHIIQEAINEGYKQYNFYGISGIFDENDPTYGVYKFKRGFPGQVEELVGDFVLPIRKGLYFIYQQIHK